MAVHKRSHSKTHDAIHHTSATIDKLTHKTKAYAVQTKSMSHQLGMYLTAYPWAWIYILIVLALFIGQWFNGYKAYSPGDNGVAYRANAGGDALPWAVTMLRVTVVINSIMMLVAGCLSFYISCLGQNAIAEPAALLLMLIVAMWYLWSYMFNLDITYALSGAAWATFLILILNIFLLLITWKINMFSIILGIHLVWTLFVFCWTLTAVVKVGASLWPPA
jgi:hypothetical protein